MPVPEMSVQELKERLDTNEPTVLLDVREPNELEISVLPGVLAIPQGEIPHRFAELDPHAPTVVICRSGRRSEDVTVFLQSRGFCCVANLVGGMNAYATEIDPTLTVY